MGGMQLDDSLFQIFITEVTGYIETLQSKDAGLLDKTDAAHGMKGASAMLGFEEISRTAAELESHFRQGHVTETQPLVDRLVGMVQDLKATQAQRLAEQDKQAGSTEPPSGHASDTREDATDDSPDHQAPTTAAPPDAPTARDTHRSAQDTDDAKDSDWDPETLAMLQTVFREEAAEHLERMEEALAVLNDDQSSSEAIHRLFRAVHTMKGAAGTVGLEVLGKAAHRFEEMLDEVRAKARFSDGQLAIAEQAVDLLRTASNDPEVMAQAEKAMTAILRQVTGRDIPTGQAGTKPTETDVPSDNATGQSASSSNHRNDAPVVETTGEKGQDGQAYRPMQERRRISDRRDHGRRDADRRVVRIPIEDIDGLMDLLAEFVFARTRIQKRAQELSDLVSDLSKTHRAFRHEVIGSGSAAGPAFRRRLAELEVELADEQANLNRAVTGLTEEAEWLGKVAGRFQEDLVQLRMQSIQFLMLRLERAVGTAARNLGRKVQITVTGADTKLDRAVAERLVDPMVHLVRNAVAHGIEPPDERRRLGKPETGQIRITAQHEGDFALLQVSDDGRGIDTEIIRQAALHKRLASDRELRDMEDSDALHLIFSPGFTTKTEADRISGRGVGLDVVHSVVSSMGGEVAVESVPGKGTTFVLRLPILAAITNALLFKLGGEVMAISVSHVGESCLIRPEDLDRPEPTTMVSGRRLPVVDLPGLLGLKRRVRGRHIPGFVVRWEHNRFVVTCDKIVGPRQIVVRPLSPLLAALPFYYGATISGSGKVQLVMDPAALALAATSRFRPTTESTEVTAETEQSRNRRVLVCDDSRSIREVLTRVLLEAGYEVEPAVDGWDAWERMGSADFDVVVTDLEMPRMDGYSLIERIRKSPRHRFLPVLVLTSRTAETNRVKAEEAGADLFMTKPIKKRIILDQVEQAIEKGRSAYNRHQDFGRYKS